MPEVFISIGSNINPADNIRTALDALQKSFGPLLISKVYQSHAVGFEGDDFLNLVVGLNGDCSVSELQQRLKQIESTSGRRRNGPKFSARALDLDILTYGDYIGTIDGVVLPREDITRYAFVLLPLLDIAADQLHPSLKQSYRSLWQNFEQAGQTLWPVDFVWRERTISSSA